MKIVNTVAEVREQVKEWRKQGLTVGLVPTMGYLHEGHKSLIDRAVADNDRVVVSVFVNPMQFGPSEDLESYPRDMDRDAALCEDAGASLIFHPEPSEMYHDDFSIFCWYNGGAIGEPNLRGGKRQRNGGYADGGSLERLFSIRKSD